MKPPANSTPFPAGNPRGREPLGRCLNRLGLACLLGLGLTVASCTVLRHETTETKSIFQTIAGGQGAAGPTNAAAELQTVVMREADEFVGAIAQATDDFRKRVPGPEAREAAQQWKLLNATAAYVNASGENPALNAVDMIVLSTLARDVIQTYWVEQKFGEAAQPLLQTHRQLESNAWAIVRGVLTAEQKTDLQTLLDEYRQKYPHVRYVAAARLPELAATLGRTSSSTPGQKPGNLFSLLYLNPLAGLDPTTQAIDQTRNLAQRAMYYAQRAPMLLGWQVELTTYQLAVQPEPRQVLTDVNDLAHSTQVFARTAEGLPQFVNEQREAAINQLFAGLAQERSNIVATLTSQESQLRELLPQVRQTLNAGSDMANSVNGAVKSLDTFVRYVNPPDTNAPTPASTSKPFDVLDYGKAASQIGAAAQELNTLLGTVNQNLPQAARLGQQVGTDAREVVNHAFRLGLVLVGAMGSVAMLVVWAHHQFGRRANR